MYLPSRCVVGTAGDSEDTWYLLDAAAELGYFGLAQRARQLQKHEVLELVHHAPFGWDDATSL